MRNDDYLIGIPPMKEQFDRYTILPEQWLDRSLIDQHLSLLLFLRKYKENKFFVDNNIVT
jgi:hypothetical protein